ncbi:uncharacterized protein BX664DRAFT_278677 [Halteromyces radiatus]|uniref:uncharacterized protein n=1 Tax=Halteromyces radiatus TaxID=101107 RepID=UPI0022208597|nr:uncharacterized protein BX664DRAFT_278677 [Halteromyces radiatus]KAI8093599.1 hypothetical protein BX664DRAFT_278677 [Halteromyces radiatus]
MPMNSEGTNALTPYSYWEIAFIYAFTILFDCSDIAPLYPIPFITPKILEDAILHDSQDILDPLMCAFLSNALNRKKLIESSSSTRPLNDYINAKVRSQDFDLGYNPLPSQQGFNGLEPDMKLKILHALVEWQLQDSASVRAIIDGTFGATKKGQINPLVPIPFGYDSYKRAYWQFGDSPYLWRERTTLKTGCEWEIVCRDLSELDTFADSLSNSKSHKEKNLAQKIKQTLIPQLEEKQRIQELRDRAAARRMAAQLALEVPRSLPRRERRKPTRYNYNENYDFDFDDDSEYSTKTESRRPTRSSGRLHGNNAINDYMEISEIDNTTWPTPPKDNDQDLHYYHDEIDIV